LSRWFGHCCCRPQCVSDQVPSCVPFPHPCKRSQQVACGGHGDIWKASTHGQTVSLKVMRIFYNDDLCRVPKEFRREAVIWRQLCHPNILPFMGSIVLENKLGLISPWMENGNVMEYLSRNPSLSATDRLSLILETALGLEYLQSHVVHGDLKGLNVLVTISGRACIADFGLASIPDLLASSMVEEEPPRLFTHSSQSIRGGTARYQAPELFTGGILNHFGSDVYAFACVCYEILTGKIPFHELQNDMKVMFKVAEGKRPSRPNSYSGTIAFDGLWELLQDCWKGTPNARPTSARIVQRLMAPPIQATTAQSTTDWDEKMTCKFRRSCEVRPLLPSITQIERIIFGEGSFPVNDHPIRSFLTCFMQKWPKTSEPCSAKCNTPSPPPSAARVGDGIHQSLMTITEQFRGIADPAA
ncbi:kinase-like domain-containing protein, partial [Mycena olivaceomarginata]